MTSDEFALQDETHAISGHCNNKRFVQSTPRTVSC